MKSSSWPTHTAKVQNHQILFGSLKAEARLLPLAKSHFNPCFFFFSFFILHSCKRGRARTLRDPTRDETVKKQSQGFMQMLPFYKITHWFYGPREEQTWVKEHLSSTSLWFAVSLQMVRWGVRRSYSTGKKTKNKPGTKNEKKKQNAKAETSCVSRYTCQVRYLWLSWCILPF